ncbi:signal transduction histidine kinase [Paraburkholderia sp. RAU6.4a]|uniref:ATP-binding protein n=1 Tax=Paraburkholderia sp. RAU6.4a TaxID=2991067 RepID=UPI003D1D4739
MIDLEKLGMMPVFAELTRERLQWLRGNLAESAVKAGQVLIDEGEMCTSLLLLLNGELTSTRRAEGHLPSERYIAPEVFGTPCLVAAIPYPSTLRAATDCGIARLAEPAFRELFMSSGPFNQAVARVMAEWLTTLEAAGQNREKLAALGKLAAGLAHELNNPVSAVIRALDCMVNGLDALEDASLTLGRSALPRDALDALQILARSKGVQTGMTGANSLRQSEAEAQLGDWLGAHRVTRPWLAAPCLVAHGIGVDDLMRLASSLNAEQFDAGIRWTLEALELHSLLQEAMRGSARIADIVKATKAYSYMDQAPQQEVDVHAGIEDTLIVMAHELKRGVTVTRNYDRGLPRLQVYGSELNQVWTRIVENAIDAMNGQGELTIRTHRGTDCAVVEISDNGPGIAPEAVPHLFEPFFTSKPANKGHARGLGLHIAYRIVVNRHGGTIQVDSRPGQTTFRVTLPLGGMATTPVSGRIGSNWSNNSS